MGDTSNRYKPEKIVSMLREAKILIERWREHYNRVQPHSSLGYRPPTPAPEAMLPGAARGLLAGCWSEIPLRHPAEERID